MSLTFNFFAQNLLQPLENTSSKLKQTEILADFFKQVKKENDQVDQYLYLCLGQMGPQFKNPQFNFGRQFMFQSLTLLVQGEGQDLFGQQSVDPQAQKSLQKRFGQLGDLGLLAQEVVENMAGAIHRQGNLSVEEVVDRLWKVIKIEGEGSQQEKISAVAQLLKGLQPLSARYVTRIIMGNLRLGFSDKTILDALSWFLSGDKSDRTELDEIYQRYPDIGQLAQTVIYQGLDQAKKISVQLGVPVIPALADRLKSSQEMIEKMGEVIIEPKYDGTRVQIHWDNQAQRLQTFTRNLEENSVMFPELNRLLNELNADQVILDAEAVGYDPSSGELVPFQKTITRKRKHDIAAAQQEVPLKFFVFDLLYLNGVSLLDQPLRDRRKKLAQIFESVPKNSDLTTSPYIVTSSPEELRSFHQEQLAKHYEGAMVKKSAGVYEAGRKGFNWVKFKHKEGTGAKLTDTIDAVVVGYYYGRGKRVKFGIGAFLVAVLDKSQDRFLTLAKIGTGLSDDQWQEMKQRADDVLAAKGNPSGFGFEVSIPENLQPDVVLPPQIVVEVAADEITTSPVHTAGVALRFPRLVRFRDDKNVSQITSVEELKQIRVA